MIEGELGLPRPLAARQRAAGAVVRSHQVPHFVQLQPRKSSRFEIELKALGKEAVLGSIADQSHPCAQGDVPYPSQPLVTHPLAADARLPLAGQIRRIHQPVGEELPGVRLLPTAVVVSGRKGHGRRFLWRGEPLTCRRGRSVDGAWIEGCRRLAGNHPRRRRELLLRPAGAEHSNARANAPKERIRLCRQSRVNMTLRCRKFGQVYRDSANGNRQT